MGTTVHLLFRCKEIRVSWPIPVSARKPKCRVLDRRHPQLATFREHLAFVKTENRAVNYSNC